jgi:hypothetical protein
MKGIELGSSVRMALYTESIWGLRMDCKWTLRSMVPHASINLKLRCNCVTTTDGWWLMKDAEPLTRSSLTPDKLGTLRSMDPHASIDLKSSSNAIVWQPLTSDDSWAIYCWCLKTVRSLRVNFMQYHHSSDAIMLHDIIINNKKDIILTKSIQLACI